MIPFHPLANLFPLIEGTEFEELVADVKANGVRLKIMLHDGAILDGRNRYLAALAAGLISPDDPVEHRGNTDLRYFVHFIGKRDGDPLAYVISCNLPRRHLNETQRGMLAARIANLGVGRPSHIPSIEGISQERAAKMAHVGVATVERSSAVLRQGAPELISAADRGIVSASAAFELAKLPLSEQAMILRGADPRAIGAIVKERRDQKTAEKKERRAGREADLGERQIEANKKLRHMDHRFGLIYADPPWREEPWSRETGLDRAADNHYETMPTGEIMALPIPGAKDCVLYVWGIVSMLPALLRVVETWGFTYRSHCIWDKGRIGLGRWFRLRHEILVCADRGDVPAPAPGTQPESVIFAKPSRHSAKPVIFHELIEAMFPTLPKIELFARSGRPGWESWGAEAPTESDETPKANNASGGDGACAGEDAPSPLIEERKLLSLIKARAWNMVSATMLEEFRARDLVISHVHPSLTRKGEARLAELEAAPPGARAAASPPHEPNARHQ